MKELTMIIGGLFLFYFMEKTVIPANKYGKIATTFFYFAIMAIAININKVLNYVLISIAVGLTLIAFVNYLIGFKVIRKTNNNKCVDKQ